ncbi:hypothetical protein K1719_011021 [Acacia pycnantha]|nr:hypothetical protein K1719_011021 [Acacia pycnantha]
MLRGEVLTALVVSGHDLILDEASMRVQLFLKDRSTQLYPPDIRKATDVAVMQRTSKSNGFVYEWFEEGGCYKITGCEVMHQGLGVHGRYHLSFMPRTSVAEDFSIELPLHCLRLKHVSDCGLIGLPTITSFKDATRVFFEPALPCLAKDFMVDTQLEFRRDNETKNKMRMLLTDAEYVLLIQDLQLYVLGTNNDLECVLFDECSTNAYMSQLENMETPIVVVLNIVRIAFLTKVMVLSYT